MNELQQLRDEITQLQTALTIKNGTIAQLKARNAQLEDRNAALAVQVEARQVPEDARMRAAAEMNRLGYGYHESHAASILIAAAPRADAAGPDYPDGPEFEGYGDRSAAPQAEHHGIGYPPCDYCGATLDYEAWHGSGILDGVDQRHIHACDSCRHLLPAAQDQGEVQSRERWTVTCGHWQDTTLAIHGERTGHIASGIDEDAAHAIVNAHNQGLPPIVAASAGQEE